MSSRYLPPNVKILSLFCSTDVGGVYRSLNGGATWAVSMVGWSARGGSAFALDPFNASRAIGYGGNSNPAGSANGLYFTSDYAGSWSQSLTLVDPCPSLDGAALAYDPSSYSPSVEGCAVAYACAASAGLLRSVDAGSSWQVVNASLQFCIVAVNSTGGLFVASNDQQMHGVYASVDGGRTLTRIRDDFTLGLAAPGSAKRPTPDDTVYVSNWAGVFKSQDGGNTFSELPGQGLLTGVPIHRITVSAADSRIMAAYWQEGAYWNTTRVFSADGGTTWALTEFNNSLAFMPYNTRTSVAALHPSQPLIALNTGGDWITASSDGGATYAWASDGYAAVMVGGLFSFNPAAPDVLMLAFQDYNGAVTVDGGSTWRYVDISGQGWGGFAYGGFALTAEVMWAGRAPSWYGQRSLVVSSDGGSTWQAAVDANGSAIVFGGLDASCGLPGSPSVGFASDWRTDDHGRTWTRMAGCTSVLAYDAAPPMQAPPLLFGVNDAAGTITSSADGGVTWVPLCPSPSGNVSDLAFDWVSRSIYVVASRALFKCSNTTSTSSSWSCSPVELPPDQYNKTVVRTVAVDPVDPAVVYAGLVADIYAASNSVVRSTFSGVPGSWEVLLLDSPLAPAPDAPLQGPHEVECLRVHPVTRALWAAGGCFGVWKAPPPPSRVLV